MRLLIALVTIARGEDRHHSQAVDDSLDSEPLVGYPSVGSSTSSTFVEAPTVNSDRYYGVEKSFFFEIRKSVNKIAFCIRSNSLLARHQVETQFASIDIILYRLAD